MPCTKARMIFSSTQKNVKKKVQNHTKSIQINLRAFHENFTKIGNCNCVKKKRKIPQQNGLKKYHKLTSNKLK